MGSSVNYGVRRRTILHKVTEWNKNPLLAENANDPAFRALKELVGRTDLEDLYRRAVPSGADHIEHFYGEKYLNLQRFMTRHMGYVKALGLDRSPPLRILDIGAGAGFFCFAAAAHGHAPVALQPPQEFHVGDGLNFVAMLNWFGITQSTQAIQKQTPIGLDEALTAPDGSPRRFDLITAFAMMFNYMGREAGEDTQGDYWSAEDYRFLFKDLLRFLAKDGRVNLKFNSTVEGAPSVDRYYASLGRLLKPLVVSYDRTTGTVLDLTRDLDPLIELEMPSPEETVRSAVFARRAEKKSRQHAKRRMAHFLPTTRA